MSPTSAFLRRPLTNHSPNLDHAGLVGHRLGRRDCAADGIDVVDIGHSLDVPAVGLVSLADVLREGERGVSIDRDQIVVVADDKFAESEVTRERGGLRGDAFLQTAVSADDEGVVVDNVEVRLVEVRREVSLSNRNANSTGNTLSQRSCTVERRIKTIKEMLMMTAYLPVETSTPGVAKFSGCPGVRDPSCLNCLRSSIEMEYPVRWSMLYRRAQAWPLLSTKRSRFDQEGFFGE